MIFLYSHNKYKSKQITNSNLMSKLFKHLGLYFIMMGKVLSTPEKWSAFRKQLVLELEKVGLNSLGIVVIISFFVGGVVSIQTA